MMAEPAVTAVNVPSGASTCPWLLLPQQVMVASASEPARVDGQPAVTAVNVPSGASTRPSPL